MKKYSNNFLWGIALSYTKMQQRRDGVCLSLYSLVGRKRYIYIYARGIARRVCVCVCRRHPFWGGGGISIEAPHRAQSHSPYTAAARGYIYMMPLSLSQQRVYIDNKRESGEVPHRRDPLSHFSSLCPHTRAVSSVKCCFLENSEFFIF